MVLSGRSHGAGPEALNPTSLEMASSHAQQYVFSVYFPEMEEC